MLAVAVLALAGCLADDAGPPGDPGPVDGQDDAGRGVPAAFTYACPPGPRSTRDSDVCASTFVDPMNSLEEPYLAIHPRDDQVMALAAHSVSTVPVAGDPPAPEAVRIAIYVTEDGGATWRRSLPPRVPIASTFGPVEARAYYDPALAFDPAGVLHLAGIASNDLGSYGGAEWDASNVPFHVATADLGRTWGVPTVLDPRFSDRAFVAADAGHVYVDWGRYTDTDLVAHLAWSADGGATWAAIETPCRGFSPPLAVDGGAELACVAGDGAQPDVASLLRLDPDQGTLAPVGPMPGVTGYRPRLGALPGGGRVVASHAATIHASASLDGGRTWSNATDVLALAGFDALAPWLKWAAPDPWGALHLEVGVSGMDGCLNGNRGAPGTCTIHHLAFEPGSWRLLAQAVLAPADGPFALHVPGNVPPPQETALGDDFYSLAFGRGHGVLLWTRDGGTEFTRVQPVFG